MRVLLGSVVSSGAMSVCVPACAAAAAAAAAAAVSAAAAAAAAASVPLASSSARCSCRSRRSARSARSLRSLWPESPCGWLAAARVRPRHVIRPGCSLAPRAANGPGVRNPVRLAPYGTVSAWSVPHTGPCCLIGYVYPPDTHQMVVSAVPRLRLFVYSLRSPPLLRRLTVAAPCRSVCRSARPPSADRALWSISCS